MKIFQKFIATILIIGFVLSLNFNLFIIKPKPAQALDAGGSWAVNIKETVLDAIGWAISDLIIKRLENNIIAWGQGRRTASNVPFAISDWVQFFEDAVIRGAARFINEEYEKLFDLSSVCDTNLKGVLDSLGFNIYPQDLDYSQYAKPTLKDDLAALGIGCQEFIDSGYSIAKGGWDSWFALMEPQNNVFGQAMMAEQERYKQMMAEKEAADKRTAVSGGYENETTTTATDMDQCKQNCAAAGPPSPECLTKCELSPGIVIRTQIKTTGDKIHKSIDSALSADMQRIISADEITELIGIFFAAILNKGIHGLGLDSIISPGTSTSRAQLKETYSYQRTFKKEQTAADKKDIRSTILSGILKSMQQLSRSIISCEEKEMLTIDDFAKNLSDILSPNVEALYTGLEGVNLKPDFEILDPPYAPYAVFGYSWSRVPASKFPDKCRKITDQLSLGSSATCRDIKSGLEPNYNSRCRECMYDYDAMNCRPNPGDPVPPFTKKTNPSTKLIQAKQKFYNSCREWYLIGLNRCDECIKRVDEKCGQLNEEQKEQCILNSCNNYSDLIGHVVSPIQDGIDFHNKCLIEEKKDACYVCLKEYFVPADFCYQIEDYMARSIVKYPALVKMKVDGLPWWTTLGPFGLPGLLVANLTIDKDKGMFIGPADEGIKAMGGECNDNWKAQKISTALICRIMPDFKFSGQQVCKTRCNVSEAQLKDLTDFSPSHADCGQDQLDIGGHEPFGVIKAGVLRMKEKCCGALWQYDTKNYTICTGKGTVMEEEEKDAEATACKPGEVQLAYIKTTMGRKLKCPDGNDCYGSKEGTSDECRRGCSSLQFTVPDMTNIASAEVRTNAAPGGSVVVVSTAACTGGDKIVGQEPKNPVPGDGPDHLCRIETYNSTNSESCCSANPRGRVKRIGKESMTCDFSNYVGRKLTLSVVSNDETDCKTSAYICVKQ